MLCIEPVLYCRLARQGRDFTLLIDIVIESLKANLSTQNLSVTFYSSFSCTDKRQSGWVTSVTKKVASHDRCCCTSAAKDNGHIKSSALSLRCNASHFIIVGNPSMVRHRNVKGITSADTATTNEREQDDTTMAMMTEATSPSVNKSDGANAKQ